MNHSHFQVESDLPFLHSADEEQLNYVCRLGTHYTQITAFINRHGTGQSLPNPGNA